MQIVSFRDNLHEMSKPILKENWEKYNQFGICWICEHKVSTHSNTGIWVLEWLKFVLLNNSDHSVNTLLLYFHYFGCKYCKMHLLDLLFEINAKIKIQF